MITIAGTSSSSVSALHCTLPSETTVQPPPTSLSQIQSAAAEGDVHCDTFVDKQTSKGDASPQFKLNPRNLPKISAEELKKICGKYPFLFPLSLGFLDVQTIFCRSIVDNSLIFFYFYASSISIHLVLYLLYKFIP